MNSATEILSFVAKRGTVETRNGGVRDLVGSVTFEEAQFLRNLIIDNAIRETLETGVANGYSTLAICSGLEITQGHHIGIDPCQMTDHDQAAIVLLEEFHLQTRFALLNGPGHLEMPNLIQENRSFEMIFIDGMHTVDFKIVDVFLADKLLHERGFLILHDLLLPSVKKTLRFIETHCDYEMLPTPALQPSTWRKIRYLAGAFFHRRAYWYSWPNSFCNMLVLRKRGSKNISWNYFRNF